MNAPENASPLRHYGPGLLDKGYPIVPILPGTKHPHSRKWQLWQADQERLDGWLKGRYARGGVGVNARHFPAVDLDIRDSEVVGVMVDWCNQHLGKTVQRVGEAPKTLMVYRTDTPFSKLNSRKYRDPSEREHKVEILGSGQQFVAYAIHKDTGQPYTWVTEKSLIDVNPADLPCITAEQAQAAVDYFESIVPDDWVEIASREKSQPEDPTLSKADRVLLYTKPRLNITAERLKTAVSMLDPDMGRAEWVKVGMGLYHQFEGSETGFDIWDGWSAQSAKYNEKEMRRCWASLLTDLRKEPVTAATIIHLAKQVYRKKKKASGRGFTLIPAKNILAKLGPIDWQVRQYFEADTTGILFGDPGSYKSFIALDIALHCALGRDWHGNPVKQGLVAYVAGEGHGGFARRLAAFSKAHDITIDETLPLYFSERAADFYTAESALEVSQAVDAIAESVGKPKLIVIDTLARNFGPGDENSTSDMNVFVDHINLYLRAKYGCTVLIVHHTGHANKERARGAMALKGALDFEYRIEKQSGRMVKMVCTKMKDAIEAPETWFEGESVVVGDFEDGMDSLVFRKTQAPAQEEPPLKGKQKACYELLRDNTENEQGIAKKRFQEMLVDAEISKNNHSARCLANDVIKKGYLVESDEGFLYIDEFYSQAMKSFSSVSSGDEDISSLAA